MSESKKTDELDRITKWFGVKEHIGDYITYKGNDEFIRTIDNVLPKHIMRDLMESLERRLTDEIVKMDDSNSKKILRALGESDPKEDDLIERRYDKASRDIMGAVSKENEKKMRPEMIALIQKINRYDNIVHHRRNSRKNTEKYVDAFNKILVEYTGMRTIDADYLATMFNYF